MALHATPDEIGILSAFVERITHRSASVKDIRELPYLLHESIRILSCPTNAALAHNVGFDRFLKHVANLVLPMIRLLEAQTGLFSLTGRRLLQMHLNLALHAWQFEFSKGLVVVVDYGFRTCRHFLKEIPEHEYESSVASHMDLMFCNY